jgi:hypothetical protein
MTDRTDIMPGGGDGGPGVPLAALHNLEVLKSTERRDRVLTLLLGGLLLLALFIQGFALLSLAGTAKTSTKTLAAQGKTISDLTVALNKANARNQSTAQFEELVRQLILANEDSGNLTPAEQKIIDQLKTINLTPPPGQQETPPSGRRGPPGPAGPPGPRTTNPPQQPPQQPPPTSPPTTQPPGPLGPPVSNVCHITRVC